MTKPSLTGLPLDARWMPPTDGARIAEPLNPTISALAERPESPGIGVVIVAGLVLAAAFAQLLVAAVVASLGAIYLWVSRARWAGRVRRQVPLPLFRRYRSWGELVEALRTSPFAVPWRGEVIRERDHIYVGRFAGTNAPVLVHTRSLQHHVHVVGATSSGKTFRFLVPAAFQIMQRRDASVMVVDLKGSRQLFNAMRLEAGRLGLPFKYFTTDTDRPSHLFNPMAMPAYTRLTLNQKTMCLLNAMGLVYSDEYGEGFFGSVNELAMRAILRAFPETRSLRTVLSILQTAGAADQLGIVRRNFEAASGLAAMLDRLADYDQIQALPGDGYPEEVHRSAIDLEDVTRRPSVLYFDLPTNLEPTGSRLVGRLAVELLVAICRRQGASRVPIYLVIDEAQHILSSSFANVISQARDLNISLWMAHQTLGDLRRTGLDFSSLVTGNPAFRVHFSGAALEDREYLERTGGMEAVNYRSVTQQEVPSLTGLFAGQLVLNSVSTTDSMRYEPRMNGELINQLNAQDDLGLVWCAPGYGLLRLKHPAFVRFGFAHSREQFARLAGLPWPAPQAGTIPSSRPRRPAAPEMLPPCPAPVARPEAPPADEGPRRAPGRRRRRAPEQPATGGTSARADRQRSEAQMEAESRELADALRALHERLAGRPPRDQGPKA